MSLYCKNTKFILTCPINKRRKLLNVLKGKCVLKLKDGRKDEKEQILKLRFVCLQTKWHSEHPLNGICTSVESFDCLIMQWFY